MAASEEAIRHYGVGSCGPRGFYGSIDVHLKLEQNFAKFMGVEDAILYSSAYAMAASSIPAFSKRSDWLVVDKSCHHALMTGGLLLLIAFPFCLLLLHCNSLFSLPCVI